MRVTKTLGWVAAAAALAVCVAAPAAAFGAEGPFVKVNGARLAAGESAEIKGSSAAGKFKVENSRGAWVECTGDKLAAGSKLIGSTGANSAAVEAKIEFSGCTQRTQSTLCGAATAVSSTLHGKVAYTESGKPIIAWSTKTKEVLAEFTSNKGECLNTKTVFQGMFGTSTVAEAEQVALNTTLVCWSGAKQWSWEVNGKLSSTIGEDTLLTLAQATCEGPGPKIELASGAKWGIYT